MSRIKDLTTERTKAIIERAWENKSIKSNWLALEEMMVSILDSELMTDSDKIPLLKETIEAYTKRGHFDGKY